MFSSDKIALLYNLCFYKVSNSKVHEKMSYKRAPENEFEKYIRASKSGELKVFLLCFINLNGFYVFASLLDEVCNLNVLDMFIKFITYTTRLPS